MAATPKISLPPPLLFGSSPALSWRLFKRRWNNFTTLTNLSSKPRGYQVALLENNLGDDAMRVYEGFHFDTPAADRTVAEILTKLESYAVGEANETYERFIFNRRCQEEGEGFENFYSDLRVLVKSCNFCDNCLNSMLRDRIVIGMRDSATRQELLKVRKLTLDKCVDLCRAAETAETHNRELKPDRVLHVSRGDTKKPTAGKGKQGCKFCGYFHVLKKNLCPAYGKTCKICNRQNHFASKCSEKTLGRATKSKTPKVHVIEGESCSSEEEWINMVHTQNHKLIKCRMTVGGNDVIFQVDPGASVNLLPVCYADNVKPTTRILKMWNDTQLNTVGTCRTTVRNPRNRKKYSVEFQVYEGNHVPILGLKASEAMGLVTVEESNFERVSQITENHEQVFNEELGSLPGIQHLHTNPDIKPTIMPTRRLPIAMRPKLRDELTRLQSLGVIEEVDEPTSWVSQVVITLKKNGKLRMCIDPRELNKALLREHYVLPILEDTLHELRQSTVFSKADLSSGYWHIKLSEESSKLTTFQTCFGRFRFKRLPFGLSVSAEIFQKKLLEAVGDLPGVVCIADDLIIHGKTMSDHDRNMRGLLERCAKLGIKLNKDKLELRMSEVTFMGHKVGSEGLKVDPEKVKAINDMEPPKGIEELRRFLGLVNYVTKFVPKAAEVMQPLHNLRKNGVPWTWSVNQQEAFDSLKNMVTKSPVLGFYDPKLELTLETDASEYGLGAALWQCGKPVAYASRSLSDTERKYAQIEKEMLGVLYGLEKFHHYTYGRSTQVITDHKPLVNITLKPLSRSPRRLQGMLLRCQDYDYTLSYRPGKDIPVADTLSRAPTSSESREESVRVSNVTFSPIKPDRLNNIRTETMKDETLVKLGEVILRGWPDEKSSIPTSVLPYFSYKDELSLQDGVIYRGERVVIPVSLRRDIKIKVHAGHLGINACLRRARDLVFWPGMSAEIRQFVETCGVCATYADKQAPTPLHLNEVPSHPWQKVGTDIFTWAGRNYMVTVDYFSKFFELDYLQDMTSSTVISKIKHHFTRHGIPDVLVSDNGTPYTSAEFAKFTKKWNFGHETISPGNSKANGAAEAAVKTAKRLMRKSKAAGEDPYLGLLNWRNTPSEDSGRSPNENIFGRRTRTLLPTSPNKLLPSHDTTNVKRIKEDRRGKLAQRYVARDTLKPLNVGDTVRMQPLKSGEKEWRQGTVDRKVNNHSYVVRTRDGGEYRRNRQHLRKRTESTHSNPAEFETRARVLITHDTNTDNLSRLVGNTTQSTPTQRTENTVETPVMASPQSTSHGGKVVSPPLPPTTTITTTRSGRTVKPVERFQCK